MSNAISQTKPITLDDWLAIASQKQVEIVDGDWVDMPAAGGLHQIIASNLLRLLDAYVYQHQTGTVFPDGMTYLMHSPTNNLKDSFVPDVSFLLAENIIATWDIEKPYPGVPDLAVEIISPNDSATDVQRKLHTYLSKGTQQVWLIYPDTQDVHQYINGDPIHLRLYSDPQHTINASALFAGITGLTLAAIFDLPPWALRDEG